MEPRRTFSSQRFRRRNIPKIPGDCASARELNGTTARFGRLDVHVGAEDERRQFCQIKAVVSHD